MSTGRCKYCIYQELVYSDIYKTYVNGCKAPIDADFKDGCKNTYKKKAPTKAFIKRRG